MRLEDLPADLQAKVRKTAGLPAREPKDRREDRGPGLPLTCTTCGEVVYPATDGRIAKHARETGHSRLEYRPA